MSTRDNHTLRPGAAPVGAKSEAKWVGPAKLVIVTQHEFTAAGLEALLLAEGHHVLARCTCWDDLLLALMSNRPDILLLNLVGREAARLISQLRADHRSMSIILMLDERDAITAASLLELDVEGILLGAACASSLLHCVESVCRGRRWVDPDLLRHLALAERTTQIASRLTKREADIANLIARGLHNKQIARELHVSEGTVKMHLHHIYEKLHLRSRTELALSVTTRAEDDLIPGQRNGPTGKASS
jgi:DNA-binding NarL/FixJ family response regulator